MKTPTFLITILFLFIGISAKSQNLDWANSVGSSDVDAANEVAVDGAGNVYVTGYFEGTVDFDPGAGTANLSAVGNEDIFIAKYDTYGDYVWAFNFGSGSDDNGNSIVVDDAGNIYVTGVFQSTIDFDPGAGTTNLTSNGIKDIFFAKYNSSGALQWAFNIGGGTSDESNRIFVDASGNVYITGDFYGTVDFDPGVGTTNLVSNGVSWDAFFAKYNNSGVLIWAYSIGSLSQDEGNGIAVDNSGNVYITGYIKASADFDPGPGTTTLVAGDAYGDIYCAKYNSSGAFLWAFSIDGSGNATDMGQFIKVDASGNVYITGYFESTADFDPGAGTSNLVSNGTFDIFLAKYNTSGTYQWAFNIGDANQDRGHGIDLDASGNVYLTGYFRGTADFDPGGGTANLTSNGFNDIFLAKYTSAGAYIYANNFGGTNNDSGNGIDLGGSTNVYIAGSFINTADFDPGAGTRNLTSNGSLDIFFAKYYSTSIPSITEWAAIILGGLLAVLGVWFVWRRF